LFIESVHKVTLHLLCIFNPQESISLHVKCNVYRFTTIFGYFVFLFQ
jgi:hypothetical protein